MHGRAGFPVAIADHSPKALAQASGLPCAAVRRSNFRRKWGFDPLLVCSNPVLSDWLKPCPSCCPRVSSERLTPSQLEAVLAHELCHVRRRDNLFASIHMIVEAVFWFHPLVWWIGARLVEERERACDEDVLSLGNQPRIYADAILNVCKLYVESPLVCVSGVTGSDIKRRIEAIMTNRRVQTLNRAKKILLATAGFAALVGPVVIGVVIGIGHVPAIHAQSAVALPSLVQVAVPTLVQAHRPQCEADFDLRRSRLRTPASLASPSTTGIIRYQDRRLVVLFFDLTTMSSDDQARVRTTAVNFIQNDLKPADLVAVMLAGDDPGVEVVQDFTDSPDVLRAAVQRVSASGSGSVSTDAGGIDARLAKIETAAKMLGGFPEKKALMYFSSGITQSGAENQAQLLQVINMAKRANVAIYPIDARGAAPLAVQTEFTTAASASPNAADAMVIHGTTSMGRGPAPQVIPTGVSPDEYNRRLAYVQTKFGSTTSAMARSYIRYGAPDQIDTPTSGTSQIWRYNYVEDFHGGAAFEFTGNTALGARIVYPPPTLSYQGQSSDAAQFAPLADALAQEPNSAKLPALKGVADLPGRHASVRCIRRRREWRLLRIECSFRSRCRSILCPGRSTSSLRSERVSIRRPRDRCAARSATARRRRPERSSRPSL